MILTIEADCWVRCLCHPLLCLLLLLLVLHRLEARMHAGQGSNHHHHMQQTQQQVARNRLHQVSLPSIDQPHLPLLPTVPPHSWQQ